MLLQKGDWETHMRWVQSKLWMQQRRCLILSGLCFRCNLKYQLLTGLHSFSLSCRNIPPEKQLELFFNFIHFVLNWIEFSIEELHKKYFLSCKYMCCRFHFFSFLFPVRCFSPLYNKIFKIILQDCLSLSCTYSFYLLFFCAWFFGILADFHIVLLCEVGECCDYYFG